MPPYDWRAANERWLELHEEAIASRPARRATDGRHPDRPLVDVCIPHFNLARYLPQTLESLAAQTTDAFRTIVVDAGSTDEASLEVFEQMRALYEPRGWLFYARERGFPGWARNVGVSLGDAPYLCFVDGDDVVAPTFLERLLAASERSGVDCVTCYAVEFEGDEWPLDPTVASSREPRRPIKPLGGSAASAILYNPYGLPHSLITRDAFDRVGGYGEDRYWGEYELHLRLVLGGGSFDVLPEYLFYYRWRPDSRSNTRVVVKEARRRAHQAFSPSLAPLELELLPELIRGKQAEIERLRALLPGDGSDPGSIARDLTWQALASGLVGKGKRRLRERLRRNGDSPR